jgi:UDP-2,3-diacylglucosamine hydrolase
MSNNSILSFISDIHVKTNDDENYRLLLEFLKSDEVMYSDEVFLLGDIFDLMIGAHSEYFEYYNEFFSSLKRLINLGKKVHFFEGNHDFHLKKLFDRYLSREGLNHQQFIYHKGIFVEKYGNRKLVICHGDEIEIGNYTYKIYNFIIRSRVLRFIANYIISFNLLNKIGRYMSDTSRAHGEGFYENKQDEIRSSSRISAICSAKKFNADMVVCGHTHILENYHFDTEQVTYLNCGYLPQTKGFFHLNNGEIRFVDISTTSK